MPFVSLWGGFAITDDIIYPERDHKTGKVIQLGNGYTPLQLTEGTACNYQADTVQFKELVWRGVPNPRKETEPGGMNWQTTPVYRCLTQKFTTDLEWQRLLNEFEKRIGQADTFIHYEPHITDIEIDKNLEEDELPKHFPLWVLDRLVELGEFERALSYSKVANPNEKKLTPAQLDKIKAALDKRKAQESKKVVASGNVSGSNK